ncbi:hatching enzyme 1.2-like [Paramacrobiotus metropolitanus]|uniref:hatching enzyme 1.2-like n=1 Tax=Paramacrobiotus metropolitanus TaxID=2943436 RepID=UPI00244601B3|nr:hatching enzyme 1.2-like [Paramacrobiotus metropolitanus]
MDYITARMCNITARTCVRFFPRTNERDYLAIVSHTGCWSFVGRQGGKQLLSLQILNKNGQSCLNGTIVEHELLHALGFVHEHTRLDRDTYIKIDLDNVEPLYREQFGKYARQFVSIIPYDVHSVMHYSSATFALNLTLPVITIVQPINATTVNVTTLLIAPALALSELDIQRINELYGCTPRPHVSGGTTTVAPVNTTVSCVDPLLTGNDDLPDPTAADTCELFGAATGAGVG